MCCKNPKIEASLCLSPQRVFAAIQLLSSDSYFFVGNHPKSVSALSLCTINQQWFFFFKRNLDDMRLLNRISGYSGLMGSFPKGKMTWKLKDFLCFFCKTCNFLFLPFSKRTETTFLRLHCSTNDPDSFTGVIESAFPRCSSYTSLLFEFHPCSCCKSRFFFHLSFSQYTRVIETQGVNWNH